MFFVCYCWLSLCTYIRAGSFGLDVCLMVSYEWCMPDGVVWVMYAWWCCRSVATARRYRGVTKTVWLSCLKPTTRTPTLNPTRTPWGVQCLGAVACEGSRLIRPARILCLEGLLGLFDRLRDAVAWKCSRLKCAAYKIPLSQSERLNSHPGRIHYQHATTTAGNSRRRIFVTVMNLCAVVNGGQYRFSCMSAGLCFFFLVLVVGRVLIQRFRKVFLSFCSGAVPVWKNPHFTCI